MIITTETALADVNDWPALAQVLEAEGIDTETMNESQRQDVMAIWEKPRDPEMDKPDSRILSAIVHRLGERHGRDLKTFCPECGEDLYETCTTLTYHRMLAVRRGSMTEPISEKQEYKEPSIGDPDVFRCTMCEFETEAASDVLRIALIGGPEPGKVVVHDRIRAELIGPVASSGRPFSLAKFHWYFSLAPAAWVEIDTRLPVPVGMDESDGAKEAVLVRACEDIRKRVDAIAKELPHTGAYDGKRIKLGLLTEVVEVLNTTVTEDIGA